MGDTKEFYYEPEEAEELSTAVVTAVARAHDEDVLDQKWIIGEDINTDALDGLFQEHNLKMTLQFEADTTTGQSLPTRTETLSSRSNHTAEYPPS